MSFLLCGSRKEWQRFDLIAGITPPIALILDCSAIPDADTTTAAIFGERIDEIEDAGTPVSFARVTPRGLEIARRGPRWERRKELDRIHPTVQVAMQKARSRTP
jgi:hypothetical protein